MITITNYPQHIKIQYSTDRFALLDKTEVRKHIDVRDNIVYLLSGTEKEITLDYKQVSSPVVTSALDLTNHVATMVSDPQLAGVVEISTATHTYYGFPLPGTTTQHQARWMIMREDDSVAGTTILEYADGDLNYDNVMANYAALTYSFIL